MIVYQVEMQDLMEIESALGMLKDKSKMVLRTSINETAKSVRALLADEAAKTYVMKRSKLLLTFGFVHNQSEVFVQKLPVLMPVLMKYRHMFYKNSPSSTSCTA